MNIITIAIGIVQGTVLGSSLMGTGEETENRG